MEFRQLGLSGFKVPALSLGTATFGGGNEFFKAWGSSDVAEATRLVDICLDAGLNLFDTADVYSPRPRGRNPRQGHRQPPRRCPDLHQGYLPNGLRSERRRFVPLPSSASLRRQPPPPRHRLHRHLPPARLRRPNPSRRDPATLDRSGQSGKVRYIACSNFSGWHLMKSLAISETYGWARYVGASGLLFADWPRLRVGVDAAGPRPESRSPRLESPRLGSPDRKNPPRPAAPKRAACIRPPISVRQSKTNTSIRVVDALDEVGRKKRESRFRWSRLNWLLQRPTVSTRLIGARNEEQLRQNLEAVGGI